MKTILLSIALTVASLPVASASHYIWKYTFQGGESWSGHFTGKAPIEGLIQEVAPTYGKYFGPDGDLINISGFELLVDHRGNPWFYENEIPISGTDGIYINFFDDASFAYEENQFMIKRGVASWQYYDGETFSKSELFEPNRWLLQTVPESPATLGLLSLSLLGLAGVKRGWRR